MSEPIHRFTITVSGRVQGVGFRHWTVTEVAAYRLTVHGTVRNLPDGNVEVIAEATDRAALEKLVALLKSGPSLSRVDGVNVLEETTATSRFTGFRVVS